MFMRVRRTVPPFTFSLSKHFVNGISSVSTGFFRFFLVLFEFRHINLQKTAKNISPPPPQSSRPRIARMNADKTNLNNPPEQPRSFLSLIRLCLQSVLIRAIRGRFVLAHVATKTEVASASLSAEHSAAPPSAQPPETAPQHPSPALAS